MARELKRVVFNDVKTMAGRWKGSFDEMGQILQIIVGPSSFDTVYDVGIKDEMGHIIWAKYGVTRFIFDTVDIPIFPGEKTIIIENASRDEDFSVKLITKT